MSPAPRRRRRGRAPLPDGERKDRLVQARIDEDLDVALRDAAKLQRVSVSQLIRNVLEDTFTLVDNVVADAAALGAGVKRDVKRVADAARGVVRDPLADVAAWQEVVLARDQACASCSKLMKKGQAAMMGITDDPGAPRPWLCVPCASKRD